jgi:hypothetical protein
MLLALAGQVALIGAMILIPTLTVQQLPLPELGSVLIAPPPPPPPPPAPAAATAPRAVHVVPRHFDANRLLAPKVVLKTVAVLPDLPAEPAEAPAMQECKVVWRRPDRRRSRWSDWRSAFARSSTASSAAGEGWRTRHA